MRIAWLLVLGACSSGPDQGAVLTFETPAGDMTATRIEVVLASASPAAIEDIDNQRVEPGSGESQAVRYYRQRARGGEVEVTSTVGGFQLRIEPDLAASPDETFIPFVLVYNGDALTSIATVQDGNGDPAPVEIKPGVMTSYTVTAQPMTAADADARIDAGKARVVTCYTDRQLAWTSGYAWAGTSHQLRLLLPDTGADATATDATMRMADLDCDDHVAANNDCDDLRGTFYNGAPESCDGLDTNCDSARYIPQACMPANSMCAGVGAAGGVQLCDDEEGNPGTCTPSAACLCQQGSTTPGCLRCIVDHTGPQNMRAACSPSVGQVHLGPCEGVACTVEVAGATNGWRAYISTQESQGFTDKLSNVHSVFLEVKHSGTQALTAAEIAEVYLLVTPNGAPPITVPIQLGMSTSQTCTPLATGSTSSRMLCTP
jgi:hypothetical protein